MTEHPERVAVDDDLAVTAVSPQADGRFARRGRHNRAAVVFAVSGLVVAGWAVLVALFADPQVRVTWAGFDGLEATAMGLAGRLAARSDPLVSLAAAGLAVFMITDLWFDVTTAPADALPTSLAMAGAVELPYAAGCLAYALRTFDRMRRR
ncbi:hypothetical protein [Kitasatospora sp. NPDC101183]|uniref:hypothetical protein n=1 Tax=Kitasatospora sp. NPDC101183 TaxID=3364100 RepID=UPI0037FA3C8C